MPADTAFNPEEWLRNCRNLKDEEIDIGITALVLAAISQPGVSLDRYFNHLKKLPEDVRAKYDELLVAGADDNAETILAAMKRIIVEENNYQGDVDTYDDLQNASLIRVIERRKGLPVTLAILYIHTGRTLGWDVAGLDFPGHFLCRIEKDGRRLIFDPFYDCRLLEAPDLRALVKKIKGPGAELSSSWFEPARTLDILIRLQNNIKYRQVEIEDYEGALKTVETMRLMAPDEFRLLLDAGVLYARTDQTIAAIRMLEEYIKKTPRESDRHDAALLLRELRELLH
jgi:regulator of sirC expression with transglutaminase-like and TPR domain